MKWGKGERTNSPSSGWQFSLFIDIPSLKKSAHHGRFMAWLLNISPRENIAQVRRAILKTAFY